MLNLEPLDATEAYMSLFVLYLKGAGTAVPTRLNGSNNYSLSRGTAGVITIKFNDDPGPTFLGIQGFCFGDATATNVLGWTVCAGTYTPPAGTTPASLVFTIGNASFAAADLLSTSSLSLQLGFKRAATDL